MVQVLVLTQFAFLALAVVLLKIMTHSVGGLDPESLAARVDPWAFWVLAIPLLWGAFARTCEIVNRAPLVPVVARVLGIVLTVLSLGVLISITMMFEG